MKSRNQKLGVKSNTNNSKTQSKTRAVTQDRYSANQTSYPNFIDDQIRITDMINEPDIQNDYSDSPFVK